MTLKHQGKVRRYLPKDFFGRAHAMTREAEVVERVVDRLDSLEGEHWTSAWMTEARRWERLARHAHQSGQVPAQVKALRSACAYYSLAAYPWLKDDYRKWAYRRVRELFDQVCELESAPAHALAIPFEGKRLRACLRRSPQSVGPQPLVIFIRGLDSTKEVTYWDESALLQKGYAIVSIDFPGMGENPCSLTQDAERQFQAVLDALASKGPYADLGVDVDKTVAWGLGFGGYWAFKLAAVDARVISAINVGGPVHHAFRASLWRYLRCYREVNFLKEVFMVALGPEFKGSLARYAYGLSLVRNGLLAGTEKPLLYINGDQDLAVSAKESEVVRQVRPAQAQERQVTLVRDGGHLAIEKIETDVLPLCFGWIDRHIRAL